MKRRLRDHNSGRTRTTKGIEWELVAELPGFDKKQAYIVEKYLKCGDTLKKRAEFYEYAHLYQDDECAAQKYYAKVLPRLRHLHWFGTEVE